MILLTGGIATFKPKLVRMRLPLCSVFLRDFSELEEQKLEEDASLVATYKPTGLKIRIQKEKERKLGKLKSLYICTHKAITHLSISIHVSSVWSFIIIFFCIFAVIL